jgi:uncharacterized protein YjiK
MNSTHNFCCRTTGPLQLLKRVWGRRLNHLGHSLWRILLGMLCCGTGLTVTGCGGGGGGSPAAASPPQLSFGAPKESLDLNNYSLVRKHRLPDVAAASTLTYNADTDSLFMMGDGATRVVQVNKSTAATIDVMNLKPGDFNDTEGLSYVGNGVFVMVEERLRQVNQWRYQAGGTLTRADVKSVKLGTDAGNSGLEGISHDPFSNGFVLIKEKDPLGVFETTIDFNAGTASNGAPNLVNSNNLFDPALLGVSGLNDLVALSKVLPTSAADHTHLLLISSASGQVLKVDRAGKVGSSLDVGSVAHHEGVAIDGQLNLYVNNELGGAGVIGEQELWVYAPTRTAAAVGLGSNLYLVFASKVVAGAGTLTISNGVDDVRAVFVNDTTRVKTSGDTVMINPKGKLKANTVYSVQYPAGAFKDAGSGEPLPAVENPTALGFKTVLPAPP